MPSEQPGDLPLPLLVLAITMVIALMGALWLMAPRQPGSEHRTPSLPAPVTDFAAALAGQDVDSAVAALAPGWTTLDLPGLPVGQAAAQRSRIESLLEHYAAGTDLELGPCRTSPTQAFASASRVVCPDAEATGVLPEALGVDGTSGVMVFDLGTDGIVAIHRSPSTAPQVAQYCAWAEATHGRAVRGWFDERCRPMPVAGDPGAHVALATEYVDRGRPTADPEYAAHRSGVAAVLAFGRHHAAGLPLHSIVTSTLDPTRLPGTLQPPPRDLTTYLAWSQVAYDLELGQCVVDPVLAERLVVDCPEATLSGPLPETLGVGPMTTTVRFEVVDQQVAAIEAAPLPLLIESANTRCPCLASYELDSLHAELARGAE